MTAREASRQAKAKVVKAQIAKLGKTPAEEAPACPVCHSRDVQVRKPERGVLPSHPMGLLGLCHACGYRSEGTL